MSDDHPDDKAYVEAVLTHLLKDPSLTEWQRAALAKVLDQEIRLQKIEAVLRAEGRLPY